MISGIGLVVRMLASQANGAGSNPASRIIIYWIRFVCYQTKKAGSVKGEGEKEMIEGEEKEKQKV